MFSTYKKSTGKSVLFLLALAGAGMFAACEKEDTMSDVEITFYKDDDVSFDVLESLAADPSVRNIYLIPPQNDRYETFTPGNITASRKWFWEPRFEISPKIHGRGDIRFKPGSASQVPEDSLWFLSKGWTINKYLQAQK